MLHNMALLKRGLPNASTGRAAATCLALAVLLGAGLGLLVAR